MLAVGNTAPQFALPDSEGRIHRLEDYRGRPLVLFFYPADFTPICTAEACFFRDFAADFQARGAALLGVSQDDESKHAAFRRLHNLPYPLLYDAGGRIAEAYKLKRFLPFLPPERVTYIVDGGGLIRAGIHKELDAKGHVDSALAELERLAS